MNYSCLWLDNVLHDKNKTCLTLLLEARAVYVKVQRLSSQPPASEWSVVLTQGVVSVTSRVSEQAVSSLHASHSLSQPEHPCP